MPAFAGWLALGLLAIFVPLGTAISMDEPRVIALAMTGSGQLVMLDSTGNLYAVDTKAQTARRMPVLLAPFSVADMGVFPGGDQVLVTMNLLSTTFIQTRLARYDLGGKRTGLWASTESSRKWGGVVVEADSRTAYLVNLRKPEIYRIDLTKDRAAPVHFALVRKAEVLGPLVLDARRRRLLAADPYGGAIYEVKLDGSGSAALLRGLEEPDALALDAASDRLFVADADTGQVLVVNLGDAVPRARTFSGKIKGLEEPHALALGHDGTLWVADYPSFTLFQLSSSGAVLNSFRPKLIAPPARR